MECRVVMPVMKTLRVLPRMKALRVVTVDDGLLP